MMNYFGFRASKNFDKAYLSLTLGYNVTVLKFPLKVSLMVFQGNIMVYHCDKTKILPLASTLALNRLIQVASPLRSLQTLALEADLSLFQNITTVRQFPGRSLPVELAEFSFPTQLRETQNDILGSGEQL